MKNFNSVWGALTLGLILGACSDVRMKTVALPQPTSPEHGSGGPGAASDRERATLAGGGGGGGTGVASGSGNGGSEVRDDYYIPVGQAVFEFLTEDPLGVKLAERFSLPVEKMGAEVGQALNRKSVEVSFSQVYDNTGSPVDAALIDGKTRLFDPSWRDYSVKNRKMYRFVFHEMLRFAGVNDDEFRISRAILNDTEGVTFNTHFEVKLVTADDLTDPMALGRAAHAGQLSFVRELLKAGANPNSHPENDEWPARFVPLTAAVNFANEAYRWGSAKKQRSKKAEELVTVLLDAGARFWNTTDDGRLILEEPSLSVETTCRILKIWARNAARPIPSDRMKEELSRDQRSRPAEEVAKLLECLHWINHPL